ncbi:hypothetical protein BC826DRAFT_1151311 [Russula brevipes]|nr:hypothetical protein BC826DRAFT_1151311 [Russula brevipes]
MCTQRVSLPDPAHHTKHLRSLDYAFLGHRFVLTQKQDGASTGTALWLGAQCLSAYLATVHKKPSRHTRPRALELGSGIGLAALALRSLGWDVLATDTAHTVSSVLSPNIASNYPRSPCDDGTIQTRELDWLVSPESWDWTNPVAVASTNSYTPQSSVTRANDTLLQPPFDLVISSDTIYTPELVQPLLLFLCIERRDSAVIDRALSEAEGIWGFTVTRINHSRVSKAMEKGGLKWKKEDWDGVEIWKLKLKNV